MSLSFKDFLIEEERQVFFTFGRMNPPTVGHGKLLDKLKEKAGRNPYKIYLSQTNDPKKNPLPFKDKLKHVRKMFPKHARNISDNAKIKNVIDILLDLYNQGYKNVTMVVGQDRVNEFDILMNKYNGKKARHGFYNFQHIKVVSAGARDPDAEDTSGASATKQRQAAYNNDYNKFTAGLPNNMSDGDSKRLFNDVRRGMGLKEQTQFRNHVQLEPVSEIREAYIKDGLFEKGDEVVMLKNERVGKIKYLGANYVIVESKGETWRCWLTDVTKVHSNEEIEYDIQTADYGATPERGPYRDLQEEYKYVEGSPESTRHARRMTPGQNEEIKGKQLLHHGELTKNFDMCPSALSAFRKNQKDGQGDKPGFHDAVVAVDKYLGFEKKLSKQGKASSSDVDMMNKLVRAAKVKIQKAGLKGHNYHSVHTDAVKDLVNESTTTPQDKDIKGRKGTQPAKYHAGLSPSTKAKRDAQFKKQTKMADDDPRAYKPAPGDATAKTKPSKFTTFVRKMVKDD